MGNIKIPADTCNQFLTKYSHVHKEILEDMNHCKEELNLLLNSEEGFHADMISETPDEMIRVWSGSRIPQLKEGFEQMETEFSNYLVTMQNEDEA